MKHKNLNPEYNKDIKTAKKILKKEGCDGIFIFGSLASGTAGPDSDIDLGITGLPAHKFFKVYAALSQKLKKPVDLVDFDEKKDFFNLLTRLGEIIKIG